MNDQLPVIQTQRPPREHRFLVSRFVLSLLLVLSVSTSYAGGWKEYVNVCQYHDLEDGSEFIWIGGGEDVINIDVPKGDEDFYERHINGMIKEEWQPLGGVDGESTITNLIWC